jgi:hypothetical protein
LLALTTDNINIALVFEMLYKISDVFEKYISKDDFSEAKLKDNYDTIFEIIDEGIDFGVSYIFINNKGTTNIRNGILEIINHNKRIQTNAIKRN